MKGLVFGMIALFSVSAMARETLKPSEVEFLVKSKATEKIRLYLNTKLKSTYKSQQIDESEVNSGNVERIVSENLLTRIVSKNVKGLITSVDSNLSVLTVSFDSSCLTPECSYTFEWSRNKGVYDLTKVPAMAEYKVEEVRSGFFGLGKPLAKVKVYLKYNKNELFNITKTTQKADGHN